MKREIFLLIASIGQLFLGIFFLFFTQIATSQLMKEPGNTALLLEKNLGVFSIAFGLVTFLSRKSADTVALRAMVIGSIFYLIASVCVDSYGVIIGIFNPAGWGGIIFRVIFIIGYAYYLAKMKVVEK